MDGTRSRLKWLWAELVRRRVLKTAAAYAAAGWIVVEASATVLPMLQLPAWAPTLVLVLVLLGFPVTVVLSWFLDLRVKRTDSVGPSPDGAALPSPSQVRASEGVPPPPQHPVPVPGDKSIVVLPFENLSGGEEAESFSDALTEDVITDLSCIPDLRVVSRTSAMLLKGTTKDARTIGRELGVRYILEGSVRRGGDRLRVTAQLIDAPEDFHLWAQRFDAKVEDVFAIEAEIACCVADALRVVLRESERLAIERVPTSDMHAYEHYLKGRQFLNQFRRKSFVFARDMFVRAVEIDPGFALAHAGLADVNALLSSYYPVGVAEMDRAEEAALRAIELEPDLAEGHAAYGSVLSLTGHPGEAEREFRIALRLRPNLYEAHYMLGRMCFQLGRMEEAVALFEKAHACRREYQAAFFAAQSYEAMGNTSQARDAYRRALVDAETHMELNPDDARAATMRAVSLVRIGRRPEGLDWAERAIAIDPEDPGVRYNVACLFAVAGSADRALDCLEEAIKAGFGNAEWLDRDPDLASLRDNPRFQELMTAHGAGEASSI